jgi:ABC-type Na+ transport system ATPase subunit NatA
MNTLLIVGVAALVAPLIISHETVKKDIPFAVGASLLLTLLSIDSDISRLNDAGRGLYLGEFLPDEHILCILRSGRYYTSSFDLSNRYQGELERICKLDPEKTYSVVYFDKQAGFFYVKRFSFEVSDNNEQSFISEGSGSRMVAISEDVYPRLQVTFKGKSISDVLEMTIEEAYDLFVNIPKIKTKLQTLLDVGLGYMKIGQSAVSISGGEAQRIKLASELQRKATGKTLFILDEPTTGLHQHDVKKLLAVLQRLVDHGDTVVVIEHNLDVIKNADYIIDLGPDGGDNGGTVVACGTPKQIAEVAESYTGQYLKRLFARERGADE